MEVKNRLEEIRLQMGYKFQKEFAEFLELHPSHYNRYERNIMQPNLTQIYKILKKLNIDFFELFYLED